MKKVSVILPVYNVEKYIRVALQSALDQTYKNLEILIVNDGSIDESIPICEKFTDPRIKIIHQENKGLAEARNTGVRHATGEYIAFLDGDDIWLPEKIETHVKHLDNAPNVGISFSRSAFIDEDGTPLNIFQMPHLRNITPEYMLRCNPVGNGSAGVFRKTVFDAIGFTERGKETQYFAQELKMSEDAECWLRMVIQTPCEIEGISEPLTLYRISANSLSANFHERRIFFFEKMFERVRTYAPELIEQSGKTVMAYRLKDMARDSVRRKNPALARDLIVKAVGRYPRMLIEESLSTATILAATFLLSILPGTAYAGLERFAKNIAGNLQRRHIARENFG